MARHKKPEEGMLRVRFDARQPARLIAGEVELDAGSEGELPAELARELAANPHVGLVLLDEPMPTPEPKSDDLPGVVAHVNPDPATELAAAATENEKE